MIKKIILNKTDSLLGEKVEINFDSKVNVIIGPKGGGKSTLFDLVASLEKSKFPKKVKDALAEYNLEFVKAIKFNNEEINVNSLSSITAKDMKKEFESRNDVIFQDDPIKKELHNIKQIDKSKFEFAKNLVDDSRSIRILLKDLRELHNEFMSLSAFNNAEINWSNTFKVESDNSSDKELLLNLNYSPNAEMEKQHAMHMYMEKFYEANDSYRTQLKKLAGDDVNLDYIGPSYKEDLEKQVAMQIKSLKEFDEFVFKAITKNQKAKEALSSFSHAYKKMVDEIKQNDFEKSGLKSFEITSKDHFRNIAKKVLKLKNKFDTLVNKEVVLDFSSVEASSEGFMSFVIPKEVKLTEDDIYALMKVIFNTPKKAISDLSMWLEMVVKKGVKEFSESKLSSALGKMLASKVDIMANGMNYEHMSLGQKSIYGIEYKFRNAKTDSMFLDQPEDNLDNYTIAKDILRLIDSKGGQTFIVTHNANIGILTNPGMVIVADLSNEETQYSKGTIVTSPEKESDSAHFLEGGTSYIKSRYDKINKGDN